MPSLFSLCWLKNARANEALVRRSASMIYLDTSVGWWLCFDLRSAAARLDWLAAVPRTLISSDWLITRPAPFGIKQRHHGLSPGPPARRGPVRAPAAGRSLKLRARFARDAFVRRRSCFKIPASAP